MAAAAKEKPRKRVESLRLSVASLTYSRFFFGEPLPSLENSSSKEHLKEEWRAQNTKS